MQFIFGLIIPEAILAHDVITPLSLNLSRIGILRILFSDRFIFGNSSKVYQRLLPVYQGAIELSS